MIDFVKNLELKNYLDEGQNNLSLRLDQLIAQGKYNDESESN